MKVRTMSKVLVVIALASQMTFGGVSYEATKNYVKSAGNSVLSYAQKGYEAAKPHVQNGCGVVAKKAKAGYRHVCAAAKPVKNGFVNGALVLCDRSGAAKIWVNHHDACIAGLTLTGMAAVYALYKYRKACQAQRKYEELKAQAAH